MPLILDAAAFACVASVHDGDTVRLCDGERVRLVNIDAPEVAGSSRCTAQSRAKLAASHNPPCCNYEAGLASRDQLRAFLSSGSPQIQRTGTHRYGRTLERLSVNGRDAGNYLISAGLARPWQ